MLGRRSRRHRLHAHAEDQLHACVPARREGNPATALKGHISPRPFYPRFRGGRKGAQRQARHLLHHKGVVPSAGLLRASAVQRNGFVHLVQRSRPLSTHAQPHLQRHIPSVFRLQAHKEGPLPQGAQIGQRHGQPLRLALGHRHPGIFPPPAELREHGLLPRHPHHGRNERRVAAAQLQQPLGPHMQHRQPLDGPRILTDGRQGHVFVSRHLIGGHVLSSCRFKRKGRRIAGAPPHAYGKEDSLTAGPLPPAGPEFRPAPPGRSCRWFPGFQGRCR